MALNPGKNLGPYQIQAQLGAGGMGEVYKARDTRLERTVAIKVLTAELSSRPELRERFEREARVVSNLNHPHICVLHDIGQQEGIDYLVMEFLEGETLAERLVKGPLPMEQALEYAIQTADALDRAHHQGVVHRDVKPGNIMLTKAGVKLLDFGLAKLRASGTAAAPLTELPTEGRTLTAEGTILGTIQYMAPEQLEGKEADPRTDIFAFGAVLYEIITGKRAFEGRSQASLIASILTFQPPPISVVQRMQCPILDRIVMRCLEKDPEERWQSAYDLKRELEWVARTDVQVTSLETPVAEKRLAWIPTLAASLLTLVLGFALAHLYRSEPSAQLVRLSIPLAEDTTLEGSLSVSPDGKWIVYRGRQEGSALLWLRPLDSDQARPLKGTEEAYAPFWSPDGRWIAFFAQDRVKKIDVTGGPAQTICNAPNAQGGAWTAEDVIVFGQLLGPLLRVPATGGEAAPALELDQERGESAQRYPHFLPDGRRLLYYSVITTYHADNALYAASLDSKSTNRIMPGETKAAFAPPGYLLFVREGNLLAQACAGEDLSFVGPATVVAEQVLDFAVSENGVLLYWSGSTIAELVWFDRKGTRLESVRDSKSIRGLSLAPDQTAIAVNRGDPRDIWLYDVSSGTPSPLTSDAFHDAFPLWSPDGKQVLFMSSREGKEDIYIKDSWGSGEAQVLYQDEMTHKHPLDWSRDGRFVLYLGQAPDTKDDLWILPLSGDRKPYPWLQSRSNESSGQFSPDVRWMAYASDETGQSEVYVEGFPRSGKKWRVSRGGSLPRWRPDGGELFYVSTDNKLLAVQVKADSATLELGIPQELFPVHPFLSNIPFVYRYDVDREGTRFLLATPIEGQSASLIHVVLNWTAALKR